MASSSTTMSFQAAGDFARTAAAPAAMLPPLQAALELASNIEQSITLFKANRHEVKDLGNFSRQLAVKLAPASGRQADKIESFVVVIKDIQDFVVEVSKRGGIVQYIQRSTIAAKLADFRKKLLDAYIAFDVSMQIDMSIGHNAAERARQEDMQATNRSLDSLSNDVSKIVKAIGPTTDASVRVRVLKDLENTRAASEGHSSQEQTVLEESIRLPRILDPNYNWWSKTFKCEFTSDDVVAALATCIDNICIGLGDLLAKGVRTEMSFTDPARMVKILIRELHAHNRNAVFIRSFQCVLKNQPLSLIQDLLVPDL